MDPRARRWLSWTFIISFFVLAPVIILSTAGFRYNFDLHRLERAGVMMVESRPAAASISLNGKPQKSETPAHLGKITPGTYAVRVEKSGYHAWTKTVSVGSRETAFLNQISLFRDEAPAILKEIGAPSATAFSSDARYAAAVASASSGAEVVVIDTKNGGAYLPYRSSANASSFRLSWSPNGRFLLIARAGKSPSFLLWSAGEPERVKDLSAETGVSLIDAFWAQDADRVYGVSKGVLYAIETDLHVAAPSGPSIAAPVVANDTLYGIAPGETPTLAHRRLRDTEFDTLAQLPSPDFMPIRGANGRIAYVSVSGERLFTVDPSGDRPTAFEGRGRDGVWSADGTKLLYWSDLEIRIYDTRSGSDELVNRLSGPIAQTAWHRPEWNALYAVGGTLYAIETSDRFGRMTVPIAHFKNMNRFAVSPNGDTAFIFGTKDGTDGLWKLRLR